MEDWVRGQVQELIQESTRRSESDSGAVFTRTHVHPDDLPLALAIDGRRHHHADVDDPAVLPDLLDQCVSHR